VAAYTRRKDDKPSWEKVARNFLLVCAVVVNIAGLIVVAGRHFVVWETVQTNARNVAIIEVRLDKAESKLDGRRVEIDTNKEEIKRLRDRLDRYRHGVRK